MVTTFVSWSLCGLSKIGDVTTCVSQSLCRLWEMADGYHQCILISVWIMRDGRWLPPLYLDLCVDYERWGMVTTSVSWSLCGLWEMGDGYHLCILMCVQLLPWGEGVCWRAAVPVPGVPHPAPGSQCGTGQTLRAYASDTEKVGFSTCMLLSYHSPCYGVGIHTHNTANIFCFWAWTEYLFCLKRLSVVFFFNE